MNHVYKSNDEPRDRLIEQKQIALTYALKLSSKKIDSVKDEMSIRACVLQAFWTEVYLSAYNQLGETY